MRLGGCMAARTQRNGAAHGRVFVSYSGPLSRAVADELTMLLNKHLKLTVRLFPYTEGKPAWEELIEALEGSTFGICCLTKDNLRSRWIHFEAGSLLHLQPVHPKGRRGSKRSASPVVPFYYPKRPSQGKDHSDDPLWSYVGLSADPNGYVRLIARIAQHFGLRRPPERTLKEAWRRSLRRVRITETEQQTLIRVGRFSPFHDQILENCNEIDDGENDFRKYLCDRVLRQVRAGTRELTKPRLEVPSFISFARKVRSELPDTLEIRALCGDKPWYKSWVNQYYRDQFDWAKAPPSCTPHARSQWLMRRVFIRSPKRHSVSVQRRIERLVKAHRALAEHRVAAGVVPEHRAREVEPNLTRVWDDLIARGFGFIALRRSDGWCVYAHMTVRHGRERQFRCARFETESVSSVALGLFAELWDLSQVSGYDPTD